MNIKQAKAIIAAHKAGLPLPTDEELKLLEDVVEVKKTEPVEEPSMTVYDAKKIIRAHKAGLPLPKTLAEMKADLEKKAEEIAKAEEELEEIQLDKMFERRCGKKLNCLMNHGKCKQWAQALGEQKSNVKSCESCRYFAYYDTDDKEVISRIDAERRYNNNVVPKVEEERVKIENAKVEYDEQERAYYEEIKASRKSNSEVKRVLNNVLVIVGVILAGIVAFKSRHYFNLLNRIQFGWIKKSQEANA